MQAFERLEVEFAKWNGLDPAGMVCCSSGTAALALALEAFRLPLGSQVICPDFTMIACARAVVAAGHKPVFVDCSDDLNIDAESLGRVTSEQVSAILAVHVYGRRTFPMTSVAPMNFYHKQEIQLIEDLAEAHGVRPHEQTDAACWSFYSNKIICGEEGGAVWFRNLEHSKLARQLRCLGFTDNHDFIHVVRGWNHRMSNIHAVLIIESLRGAHLNIQKRRRIEQWHEAICPAEWKMPPRDAVWVYDLRIPGLTWEWQQVIIKSLNEAGIAARMSFKPMHLQPEFRDERVVESLAETSKAVKASKEVFYLPCDPRTVTEESVKLAFEIVKKTLEQLT